MARVARVVIPGSPHHVTQRGNLQGDVFFDDGDRRVYLKILGECCERYGARILAWCLMSNHVHLVIIPDREDGLARGLGRTHNDYARWLHVQRRQVGHLWQNRFFSCPIEDRHLWEAIRYVELNPVRAGMVQQAEDWPWSSAAAHIENYDRLGLLDMAWWREQYHGGPWHEVLASGFVDAQTIGRLREATRTGRPFGSEAYIERLEQETGRILRPRRTGPKQHPVVSVAGDATS